MAIGIATGIAYAAPHIVRFGAKRLSLAIIKRAAQQAIKTGATATAKKVAKQQIGRTLKGATLKGLRTRPGYIARGGLRKLTDAQELARIQKILGPTKLPKGSLTKNLRELAKQPWKMENMGLRGGRYLGKEKAAYSKLSKLGKLRYNLETGRINPNAVGRNALRLHVQGEAYGAVIGAGAAGIRGVGNIKEGNKLRQQQLEAELLMESLTGKQKLEAEQELESLEKEKAVDNKAPVTTIADVRNTVGPKLENQPTGGNIETDKPPEVTPIEDDGGRQAWLDKYANSPAAKAGFSDDERWALQQQHRKWKKNRRRQ